MVPAVNLPFPRKNSKRRSAGWPLTGCGVKQISELFGMPLSACEARVYQLALQLKTAQKKELNRFNLCDRAYAIPVLRHGGYDPFARNKRMD